MSLGDAIAILALLVLAGYMFAQARYLRRIANAVEAARLEAAASRSTDDRSRHRAQLRARLHHEFVLSNDGISSAMLAGNEPLPRDWVGAKLKQWNITDIAPDDVL